MISSPGTRRVLRVGAPLVAAAAIGAGAAVAVQGGSDGRNQPAATRTATAQPAALAKTLSAAEIYDRAAPGVVEIDVSATVDDGFSPFGPQESQGSGSGFVLDKSGRIVTNAHVVQSADSITVRFHDGSQAKATLVGGDASTDVAVIKVNVAASKLTPLPLGNASEVEPGQGVVALGSPFGLEGTITAGIVSAVDRTIQAPDGSSITGVIQTDAAINQGNSGGPLLNAEGEVIGINSQIEGNSGGNVGVGFAVSIDTIRSIASQLISSGKVEHAFLGVQVQTVTTPRAGVRIQSVQASSPASRAGLQTGDVIVSINSKAVRTTAQVQAAIAARKPGDRVQLGVVRNGDSRAISATLAARAS